MAKEKRRHQGKTRLSGRNTLETLNDLLQVFNNVLQKNEQLNTVNTQSDLYALRQRIKTLSPTKDAGSSASRPKASIKKVEVMQNSFIQALTTIATNVWRARNKMVDSESGEAKEEMKRVYRYVEAVFDALNQIGIEVRDLQGRAYDSGMALKVISFEPTPGLSKEEITETIKPTITLQGQLVQMGEVIVGTPQAK